MTQLVPLNVTQHRALKLKKNSVALIAEAHQVINLYADEICPASLCLPVFLTRSEQTGHWGPTLLTSLITGEQPHVVKQNWVLSFCPAKLSTAPFFAVVDNQLESGYRLIIDSQSPALSSNQGTALFDNDGQESELIQQLRRQLQSGLQRDVQTQMFIDYCNKLELFQSLQLDVQFDNGSSTPIQGLYGINEERLQALSAESLYSLNQKGYLLVLHAMLLSMHQLNSLLLRHNSTAKNNPIKQIKIRLNR